MARPRIEIDWEEFEKLCALHCTLIEISEWFNCSEDTIERACKRHYSENFADVFKKKSGRGKISLRRRMYKAAVDEGNITMMIWLSKQMLGMRDKQEIEDISKPKEQTIYVTEWGSYDPIKKDDTNA